MTGSETVPETPARADDGGRRPVARILAVTVVTVAAVAGAAWYAVTGRTLDRVTIEAGSPRCTGVEVEEYTDSDDPSAAFVRPAIPMTPEMECTLVYRITNDTGRDVRVTRFVFPAGGERGGAGFRVTAINGVPAEDLQEDIDAIWTEGVDVPAHDSVDLSVDLRFRGNGCSGTGIRQWARTTTEVGFLGRTREFNGPETPVFRGTRESSCAG